MRIRLHEKMSAEVFADIYSQPYDHTKWDEHRRRITWTTHRIHEFMATHKIFSAADLSCGDGVILRSLNIPRKEFGDVVHASHLTMTRPIEEAIKLIKPTDLLICTETLEHLDDPDTFMNHAAQVCRYGVFTTPLGETDPDKNFEHYWGWDEEGVRELLVRGMWTPIYQDTLIDEYYTYQLWIAESRIWESA